MFGNAAFYNESIRKYVLSFATLFNDIRIFRKDNDGVEQQRFKVPIAYGPRQKFLSRINEDPNLTNPAITLPRIGVEMTGIQYDGTRKLTSRMKNFQIRNDNSEFLTNFTPVPYNLSFEVTVMSKYYEDGTKIIEQILPFFTPDFTVKVEMIEDMQLVMDTAIVLDSVNQEDAYDGNYETRRVSIWTLNFTLKGYFFGPQTSTKIIKFIKVNMHGSMQSNTANEYIAITPGLTANGEPTKVFEDSVPYADINFDDDWDYVIRLEDYDG